MKRLELTKELMTGIEEVDNQHRELFDRGNAVLFQESGEMTIDETLSTLAYLMRYIDEHFSAEERIMEYYEYDGLRRHQKQHEIIRDDVKEIHLGLQEKRTVKGLETELYDLFTDWFTYHIMTWDLEYSLFLKKHFNLASIKIPDLGDLGDTVDMGDIGSLP